MIRQRKIELLAPAKNLECGIAAVDHGADAIYIGAPRFGARAAAGNSLEDIAELVRYAHVYNVRIYVTVNTILKDEELKDTEKMIWDLYRAGVDALIVQDMGLLELNLPPIPLHASTQMDNRTSQKVRFLAEAGFRQVVLARELSLVEIENIHHACPDVPLEVFVHGALCVSYSGQCYVSQACFGRSANRGECAQFCRLAFDMIDADGKSIVRNKHLLSLKDLNQSEELEQLLDAGASSLKIEGRLKDVSYVKNVTAYYRQKLDTIFKRRKEYIRASSGEVKLEFKPQLDKSFSRGFTNYFLFDRNKDIFSFDTPKSLGEEMGTVKEIRGNYLTVAGIKSFNNGDGVCILPEWGRMIAAIVTFVVMSPFLWALMVKEVSMSLIRKLGEGSVNRVPLTLMIVFRILLALFFVIYYLSIVHSQRTGVLLGLGIFIVVLILLSKRIQKQFMRIENIFMDNLNERELRKTGRNTSLVSDMHLAYMDVNADCPFAGRRLMDSDLRKEYGINVVSIQRGTRRINIPKGETRIFPGDTIGVIGTDDQIQSLLTVVEGSESPEEETDNREVTFTHVVVPGNSPLIGQTSSSLSIRNKNNCLVVGIERADGTFHQPDGQTCFEAHDVIWLVGEPDNIKQLIQDKIENHIQHT